MPELHETRIIEIDVRVSNMESPYDMIIGNDVLQIIGLKINYEDMTVEWEQNSTPMKSVDCDIPEHFAIEDSEAVQEATNRVKRILDAKYEPASLLEIVQSCTHLTIPERNKLFILLKDFEDLFAGTLGKWKNEQ